MKNTILVVFAFISLQVFSQQNDKDTDQRTVFSVVAGINTLKVAESDFFTQTSDENIGYSLGIQYTIFPDYEFSKALFRFGLEYVKEQATSNRETSFQLQTVTNTINTLSLIHI